MDRYILNKFKLDEIQNRIIAKINQFKCTRTDITQDSNLYFDLGFDSLTLVIFLTEIENDFDINFDLLEMEECLIVKNLIKLCNEKLKEK